MKDRERTPSFLFPRDGDVMVGGADGAVCDGGLMITAVIAAPAGAAVLVNGMPARRNAEGLFEADVLLDGPHNRLEATDATTSAGETVTVYVFWRAWRTYRFTVDDFIRSFQNLNEHRDVYGSIFEDPYLGLFRDAHLLYGSRVHINAFYGTDDGAFDLSMMTDRFRPELEARCV